jgi:hypothetical protein
MREKRVYSVLIRKLEGRQQSVDFGVDGRQI